jgi:hypothetical protein
MTKALVGPLPSIRFRDGTVVAYKPPRDTIDGDRWSACTDHRAACDCREAEFAEQISELRAELREAQEAARRILEGHPTYAYEPGVTGSRPVGCMCTGCRIARDAHLIPSYAADSGARDEVDGLDPDSVDAGWRWKVCHPQMRAEHPGVCDWAYLRPGGERGPFHEHLLYETGEPVRDYRDEVPF